MRKGIAVIITVLLLQAALLAQGWTAGLGGDVTLAGSAALFPRGQDNRPSIGVQEDTDSGIRFPAAGQISFILNGVREVLFDTNGFLVNTDYFNFGTVQGTTGYGLRDNAGAIEFKNSGGAWTAFAAGGAPTDATFITQTAHASLSAEQALSALSSGIMRVATTTGVITSLTDSAGIAANLSDETGTGALVFGTSPALTGAALTSPSITTPTFTGAATGTYTLGGTPTLPLISSTNYPATTSAQLAGVISDETGSGALVYGTSPTIATPTFTGTTVLNGLTYTWPASQAANYELRTNGSGGLSWAEPAMRLLHANSGTTTSTSAVNVDTVAISGLTEKDTLYVITQCQMVTQNDGGGGMTLYNNTDAVLIGNACLSIVSGETFAGTSTVSQSQNSSTSVIFFVAGYGTVRLQSNTVNVAAVTTAWTGSWTLALREVGVVAGGTRRWRWAVYKVAGQ